MLSKIWKKVWRKGGLISDNKKENNDKVIIALAIYRKSTPK